MYLECRFIKHVTQQYYRKIDRITESDIARAIFATTPGPGAAVYSVSLPT